MTLDIQLLTINYRPSTFNCSVCASAAILALSLAAQGPPTSNSPSHTDAVVPAVVQLLAVGAGARGQNQDCSATGFFVNEEGYVLTNAHVVEKSRECLSKNAEAKIVAKLPQAASARSVSSQPIQNAIAISCDVVGLDETHDLAVLKTERATQTDGGGNPYVRLNGAEVPPGTAVKVTGHPAFAWVALTQAGHVIDRRQLALLEGSSDSSEVLILDIPLRVGNSGSPVYLNAGSGVMGIVERRASDHSQTLAVPIRYAIDLLNRLGVKWHAVN